MLIASPHIATSSVKLYSIKCVLCSSRSVLFCIVSIVLISYNLKTSFLFFFCVFPFYINLERSALFYCTGFSTAIFLFAKTFFFCYIYIYIYIYIFQYVFTVFSVVLNCCTRAVLEIQNFL